MTEKKTKKTKLKKKKCGIDSPSLMESLKTLERPKNRPKKCLKLL